MLEQLTLGNISLITSVEFIQLEMMDKSVHNNSEISFLEYLILKEGVSPHQVLIVKVLDILSPVNKKEKKKISKIL